ncbi:MAG: ECF-type sigma factor [Gammaproteobacteria bacterium]
MSDGNPTKLLHRWRGGDKAARDELLSVLYDDMRRVAASLLRYDAMRVQLDPTELVNESALRLLGLERMDWNDRAHFLAVSANVMRRVLVDQARRHRAQKRDGIHVTLLTNVQAVDGDVDLLALDEALTTLSEVSAERAQIVELRFFAGMSNDEIAAVLSLSPSTVKRRWRVARAFLAEALA